jgi:hypothetical protein
MLGLRRLIGLGASTACHSDGFIFFFNFTQLQTEPIKTRTGYTNSLPIRVHLPVSNFCRISCVYWPDNGHRTKHTAKNIDKHGAILQSLRSNPTPSTAYPVVPSAMPWIQVGDSKCTFSLSILILGTRRFLRSNSICNLYLYIQLLCINVYSGM